MRKTVTNETRLRIEAYKKSFAASSSDVSALCRREIARVVTSDGHVTEPLWLEALYEFCAERGHLGQFERQYAIRIGEPLPGEPHGRCSGCKGNGKIKCRRCEGTTRRKCCECGQQTDCHECDADGMAECQSCKWSGCAKTKDSATAP